MILTTLTVLLAGATDPMTAMVWGGGTTRAEADASLTAFEASQKTWQGALTLAKNFPRIVESKDVPGMKPGFVVVLLGYCSDADAAPTLELLKQFETSIYGRAVQQGGELSCPRLATGFERVTDRVLKTKEAELRGLFLKTPTGLTLFLQLHSRAGALLENQVVASGQLRDDRPCDLAVAEQGIGVDLECVIPQGCPVVGSETGERRFTIKNGGISSKYRVVTSDTPPCRGE